MNDIDPKLLKIVALAKQGIGGERTTAIELVKKICLREGLSYDDVMSDAIDVQDYELHIKYRNEFERRVIIQVCYRFACSAEHSKLKGNDHYKEFYYTTTPSRHLETIHAAAVYLKAFRKERKKFMDDLTRAFTAKHRLYAQYDDPDESDDDEIKLPTMDDLRAMQRRASIAEGMDDITIHKQIGSV